MNECDDDGISKIYMLVNGYHVPPSVETGYFPYSLTSLEETVSNKYAPL